MKISSLKNKISSLQKQLKDSQNKILDIQNLLEKLSPKQRQRFDLIFPTCPDLHIENIDRALNICKKAIASNNEKNARLMQSLGYSLDEFLKQYPEVRKEFLCDYEETVIQFQKNIELEKEKDYKKEQIQKEIDIINSYQKIDVSEQKDFEAFKNMTEAKNHYKDEGNEMFDCGQGFYQDESVSYCFIQDVFFKVNLTAHIVSSKQEVGERLYWVDSLKDIKIEPANFQDFKVLKQKEKEELIAKKKEELERLINS